MHDVEGVPGLKPMLNSANIYLIRREFEMYTSAKLKKETKT